MKEIFKTIGKYWYAILLVIGLLIGQAICDLALPDYTSKIVNIGIQQGGIESAVYEVISEDTFNKLMLFIDEEDKEIVKDSYKYITKKDITKDEYAKYLEEYPIIKDDNLYLIKNLKNKDIDKLNDILVLPTVLVYNMSKSDFDITKVAPNIEASLKDRDPFALIAMLDDDTRNLMLKGIKEKYKDVEPSLIEQSAIVGIKDEYKHVGIDVKKIQNNYILFSGLKMLLIALVSMLITALTVLVSSRISAYFSKNLRSKVVNKVMSFSNKEFEDFSSASLITRCTNDIQQIQMLIVMFLRTVIYAPIIGIGAFSKVYNSSMSWVIGVGILSILSVVILLFSISLPKFNKIQVLIDKLNLVSREILTGLPVIRAFSNDKHEEKRFDIANKNLTKVTLFVNKTMSLMGPAMTLIMNGISILIIWVGAKKVDLGTMQVGTLIALITYTMQIIMAFLMISMLSIMLPRAIISLKRIGEIFNKELSLKEKDNLKSFNIRKKGQIEFQHVYFKYPEAEEYVLEDISFKIEKGTTTAIIGSTGSGKSTLIQLIPRFYDVTKGKIIIDGVNIKNVGIKDLRSRIGFVPQKGMLFKGTIESNVALGLDKISDECLNKALEISQAKEFVYSKRKKKNTEISQGGTNVSGGQRQRLAIARAIAINPEFYIFDDSFSALDYKTDVKLRKALSEETKDATILIVAQRISTILNADQIIVLDQGKIVGIGKHKELIKKCDVYKEIALSQLKEEELNHE